MKSRLTILILAIFSLTLGSCVHEWPEPPATRPALLTIHHEGIDGENEGWDLIYHNTEARRTRALNDVMARYTYEVYPAGTTKNCVLRSVIYNSDLSLKDFDARIILPEGDYDIYMYNDFVKPDKDPIFYNTGSFSGITYLDPYRGNDARKDAFSGKLTVNVPKSIDDKVSVEGTMVLRRPLTAYAFVATDLRDFIENEITRRTLPRPAPGERPGSFDIKAYIPDFDRYQVKFSYTGFLPSVFDMFINKPIDSATGVSYRCPISALNSDEVLCGFDFFFCNGEESGIRVALQVFDPNGNVVATSPNFDIPVKMSHCTVVRGEFLTSKATSGVGISPDFDGEFNIEVNL